MTQDYRHGPLDWISPAAVLFFVLVVLFAALVYLLLQSRIVIRMSYKGGQGENEKFELTASAFGGFVKFRLKGPLLRVGPWTLNLKRDKTKGRPIGHNPNAPDEPQQPGLMEKIHLVLHEIDGMTDWMKQSIGQIRITSWKWDTAVGTGEAVSTAMATGAAWSAQTTATGVVSQLVQLTDPPLMTIRPLFGGSPHFSTVWSCMSELRVWHIFLAGFHLLRRMRSLRGGYSLMRTLRPRT